MRIIYDDLIEAGRTMIRCENTVKKNMCRYCPFFDNCIMDDIETRQVYCGEIDRPTIDSEGVWA